MMPFIPFASPEIGPEEIQEVVKTLESGWLTTGPQVKRFEKSFSEFLGGAVEAVAVNSATAGLHLALEAIGIGEGDEVITTPNTFTATAEVIRYFRAHPVFVDIDPVTLNLDPRNIEAAITTRTRAILPVHFAGLSCDMEAIQKIAHAHGLHVIEDAAHALPTTWRGTLVGTLPTDATVFSFYANKTITTGEGGMLVTRNPKIAQRCRTMRLHGISADVFERYTSNKPQWYYEVIAPGFKYNMTDIAASLGIHQLAKAHTFQKKRARLAARYHAALADLPLILPAPPLSGDLHAWHLYVIRLQEGVGIARDTVIERLFAAGIGCSVHFIPLHLHPYWKQEYALRPEQLPIATREYTRSISIPLYSRMTDDMQDRVIASIRSVLKG